MLLFLHKFVLIICVHSYIDLIIMHYGWKIGLPEFDRKQTFHQSNHLLHGEK